MYKIITLFISIIIIFIGSICAYSFDKEPGSISIGDQPEFSYVKITTIGSALGIAPIFYLDSNKSMKWKKSEGSFLLEGVGFVIKDGYIITAAHVVHPTQISIGLDKYCHHTDSPIKILYRSIIITKDTEIDRISQGTYARIYYLNIDHDIAILKFEPNNIYDPVPYELTETKQGEFRDYYSLLQPGDSVAVIARCRNEDGDWIYGFEIRYGTVVSDGIKDLPNHMIPAFNMNDFTTDVTMYPGDSGSAMFAFSLGKPVIVGVVRTANDVPSPFGVIPSKKGFRSYATRVDFVKKILESE